MRRIRDIADLGMPLLDQSRTALSARRCGALEPDCPSPQRAVAARIVGALGGFEIVG